MAFDWRGFFLLAHELRNEIEESKRRTAVGRAYYYAYNATLIEAKKLGFNPVASRRSGGVHKTLWKWCQNHSDPRIALLGDSGITLKARRTVVDYYDYPAPSGQFVLQQLDETKAFEELLAQIVGAPVPPPLA